MDGNTWTDGHDRSALKFTLRDDKKYNFAKREFESKINMSRCPCAAVHLPCPSVAVHMLPSIFLGEASFAVHMLHSIFLGEASFAVHMLPSIFLGEAFFFNTIFGIVLTKINPSRE